MREWTEGKAFDAIIDSEYRALGEAHQELYGIVGYQLRHQLRDAVVPTIMGKTVTEMYAATAAGTEGVLEFELVDATSRVYAARCRHYRIVEIVWERCVPPHERLFNFAKQR